MTRNHIVCAALMVCALGCNNVPPPPADPGPSADAAPYKLAAEPAGAKGVIATRTDAKDGDPVVIVGRVGGSAKPFTAGRATFLIVDPSLKPSMECKCPWDYCETPDADLKAGTATVKVVDAAGKTLNAGAKDLFGLKELTTVVVTGTAKRDDQGNLTVLARGLYVRPDQP
jgi:hypothetical protein